MESQVWAIAIKGDSSTHALKAETDQYAKSYPFKVPADGLRVGTLDSLMSLSDDLAKMEVLAEATVAKFYKQLQDLVPDMEPTIMGGMSHGPLFPLHQAFCCAYHHHGHRREAAPSSTTYPYAVGGGRRCLHRRPRRRL